MYIDLHFIKCITIGDRTYVYEFDKKTSQQSSEWRFEDELKPKNQDAISGGGV